MLPMYCAYFFHRVIYKLRACHKNTASLQKISQTFVLSTRQFSFAIFT